MFYRLVTTLWNVSPGSSNSDPIHAIFPNVFRTLAFKIRTHFQSGLPSQSRK